VAGIIATGEHRRRPRIRPSMPALRLTLLGQFELRSDAHPVTLPPSAQRLTAFLALQQRDLPRPYVAATLWLDASEQRAAARLRSVLWRLHRPGTPVVEASSTHLRLSPLVRVDVQEMLLQAHRLIDPSAGEQAGDLSAAPLSGELLPGWYDDWVIFERERLRQLRLHALEALCDRLVGASQFGSAVEAGMTAVSAEPLRESAHHALIRAYLAEGNRAEAIRHFRRYRLLLREELGLDPSAQILDLVHGLPVG
jgi:DNA-binding SARP family transcriptional activator